jgi:hypothetical protein
VAIIDEKGEYMFDPISFGDNHWIYNGFSKGLLCYRKGGDRDFNYMDIHGQTKLEEILPADDCEFDEEGFLRVLGLEDKKPNTIAFINTDGEIAF